MAQKKTAAAKTTRNKAKARVRKVAPLLTVVEASEESAASEVNTPSRQTAPVSAKASSQGFGEPAIVGQENFDACVQCGTIVAKGVETLGNEVMTFTQTRIEADLAAAKNIMAAGTLLEIIDLQTDFAQSRLACMTSETAKLGELSMRFASLAMEPLRSRLDASAWTIFRPLGQ